MPVFGRPDLGFGTSPLAGAQPFGPPGTASVAAEPPTSMSVPGALQPREPYQLPQVPHVANFNPQLDPVQQAWLAEQRARRAGVGMTGTPPGMARAAAANPNFQLPGPIAARPAIPGQPMRVR